jgi:hypothetical protein
MKNNQSLKSRKCPECGGPLFSESVMMEKKDACYYKVKSRYKVWPSAYACVPEETSKALTKEGWKKVDELNIGDNILTYNMQKDVMEFKPITNLHRYKNAETNVIRSGNTGFVFECTPNHKWVIKFPEQKTSKIGKYEKTNNMALLESTDMIDFKHKKHLVVTAPYEGGESIRKDKIFKYGDNWIKYILDISPEQRQSWLFSAIVYDGNQCKARRLTENNNSISNLDWEYSGNYGKQSFNFKQKDVEHRNAFILAAFLNGGTVTWKEYYNHEIYSCYYVSNKRYKNLTNFKIIKENKTDVWCPETENGTWVMMQETDGCGIITITGNSGALVKCRKKGSKNWGAKKENMNYTNIQENETVDQEALDKKNLNFIKKLAGADYKPDNTLSDSDKQQMLATALQQPEMTADPKNIIKFVLSIGYDIESVLASIPPGMDLSKDLPKK